MLVAVLGPQDTGNKVADFVASETRVVRLAIGSLMIPRGRRLPWVALMVASGIWVWFSLMSEPDASGYLVLIGLGICLAALERRGPEILRAPALLCLAFVLGVLACGLRVWVVDAPMLNFRYYGPVTGRIVEIDRSQSDALRITLDQVLLDRIPPNRTPERVRLSLRARQAGHPPSPGETVLATAHLSAPNGAVEPGAFDFRRMAYFDQLGAVGYSTVPLMLWEPATPGAVLIDRLRNHLSSGMMAQMPSQGGAFAAGAMTGDRSGINQSTVQDLRDSSLAHLLAISGMNLAFLIAFVFGLVRYGLALIPWVALRVNTKKVAAALSFGVAAFYLALSGSNVATERAFIMVSVVLGAVLLDRKALTLRSVAIAAIVLLLWKPESLLEPGFQMSFAATVGLIAGFRGLDRLSQVGRWPFWARSAFTLFFSSVIGAVATSPFAAAHFNRFTGYGLLANLLTVPVMGSVVMPAGAIAALLAPFGLHPLPLWVMEQGSIWILFIAHWVAGLSGAVTAIPMPPHVVLPLVTAGAAFLILLPGLWRGIGVIPLIVAAILWAAASRPDLLISDDGQLVGIMGPEGRALSVAQGGGFVARSWLENDGDLSDQDEAARRAGFEGPETARTFAMAGVSGIALRGKGALERVGLACQRHDLVIINQLVEERPKGDCLLFDVAALRATGAFAFYAEDQVFRGIATHRQHRPWSPRAAGDIASDIILRRGNDQ